MKILNRKPWAYYNDFDADAVDWLRSLIKGGLIPDGEVDPRSILEVTASDLTQFTQCHFFAGLGGWPHALRLAGWRDEWPVWSGSPPCQPFSQAGRQESLNDERHLAPHFIGLVGSARPGLLFGEQVASAEVFGKVAGGAAKKPEQEPKWAWLDDLSDRLEASRYAVGASDFPSAGVGAPHIRQRTFFGAYDLNGMVNACNKGLEGHWGLGDIHDPQLRQGQGRRGSQAGVAVGMADRHHHNRQSQNPLTRLHNEEYHLEPRSHSNRMADLQDDRFARCPSREEYEGWVGSTSDSSFAASEAGTVGEGRTNPLHGFWRDADWLFCRDGKWRPVEPGTFPLADGLPVSMGSMAPELRRLAEVAGLDAASLKSARNYRVSALRGYGNAINPYAAAIFIQSFCESLDALGDDLDDLL